MTYQNFFKRAQRDAPPHPWQSELARSSTCSDRLIRIPTGFGKTLGVLTAWLWHRIELQEDSWPRRLVWCLPMRVLVEQTQAEAGRALDALGLKDDVGLHLLMGGSNSGDWHIAPERYAILIGTQDMLLSRALNRGYGSPRARWPMEFGLLNQDCLWVMDEVQLMDVGLASSAQLQQFRNDDQSKSLRPCHTWWMSATLQPAWLAKSPDTETFAGALEKTALRIAPEQRSGPLWDEDKVSKPCRIESVKDIKALHKLVTHKHEAGRAGPSLVVLNTVDRAVALYQSLLKDKALQGVDIRLVHSRFRLIERQTWREVFLNRRACAPGTNRIIVATQVVEAGVDISAGVLFTELAPWASLVQRFGRCARWGGTAEVIVADFGAKDDKAAAPYTADELTASLEALGRLHNVAPLHLESFEESVPEMLPRLYPYAPKHLLLRHELDELFDTSPDLSGADVDISRFIRSGDERDVQVFWADIPPKENPASLLKPAREQLCAVPFLKAREWLCDKAPRLKKGMRAWVWDWLDGAWRTAERSDLYPGATVLVDSKCGGYDVSTGWRPDAGALKPEWLTPPLSADPATEADATEDDESLSVLANTNPWQTIAFHCRETGREARDIAGQLSPKYSPLFDLAGRWHDAGKAHPAFQSSIIGTARPQRADLAKAPNGAWLAPHRLYPMPHGSRRTGFRHELASTLALFAVLQRHAPDHAALRGQYRALLEKLHSALPGPTGNAPPTPLEQEIIALDRSQFDLLAWLVCTHHGKVRIAWHASPADQKAGDERLRIRGMREGDALPPLALADSRGEFQELPATVLDLAPAAAGLNPRTGPGWTERVLGLLASHGPFTLAYLEALMRAADIRASRNSSLVDPLLSPQNAAHGLESRHSRVAQIASGSAEGTESGTQRRSDLAEHDVRARAGGSGLAEGSTEPAEATRGFDTALGRLSYSELYRQLAAPLSYIGRRIRDGLYANQPLDQHLLLRFHAELTEALFPDQAGRYRQKDVQVSAHQPPPWHQVSALIVDYVRNLNARLESLRAEPDDRWLETLAYAEGELLSIHPFPDFNGRVSRVWMMETLRRMGTPLVDVVPTDLAFRERYFTALAAADRRDWQPLMALWRERLEFPGEQP